VIVDEKNVPNVTTCPIGKTVALFCGACLFVALLMATYGLDLSAVFSSAGHLSRSPQTDLSPLLKMRRATQTCHEHAGLSDRANVSHVRMPVRQQNLDFREIGAMTAATRTGQGRGDL
jgi:hypothetical protein